MRQCKTIVLAAMCAAAVASASAVEVSPDEAREAVAGWAALQEALAGGARFGASAITGVKPCSGADGKGVFYVITFEGGGYAIASGDTETEPILGYSAEGEWVDDETRNPLLVMLKLDVAAMSEAQNGTARSGAKKLQSATPAASESPAAKRWAKLRRAANAASARPRLLASTVTTVTDEQISAADLRVGELLETRWAQGSVGGRNCYNACTPLNSACGCVATMAAQMMRYHRWPQREVTFGKTNRLGDARWSYGRTVRQSDGTTDGCWEVWANELLDANGLYRSGGFQINGYQSTVEAAQAGKRKSDYTPWEPAFGGTYDWDKMPAVPSGSSSDEELLEIGRLCRDVGLTAYMAYIGGVSGAPGLAPLALSLVDTFGYADAKFKNAPGADDIRNGILACLDAKLPVGVAVPGHAIVADGYGFAGDEGDMTLYVHFNFGWGGGGSWYRPPVVYDGASLGGSDNKYDSINQILYNVYPEGDEGASIVSGRVLDKDGNPLAGVAVSAGAEASCATDNHGIYALFLSPGEHSVRVVSGSTVATTNLTVVATTNPTKIYNDGNFSTGGSFVGNVWGVDLKLVEARETALGWINETADTTGETGGWSSGIVYDQETKKATLSGENVFTPLPSGGNTATLEFTARFDAVTDDPADMDSDAQMALCIGANGKFRVWSGGGWVDVSADGITPSEDVEYTVRIVFDYRTGRYSASVSVPGGNFIPLIDGAGNAGFAISSDADAVGRVIMRGDCVFASLVGTYCTISGFAPGDITGEDAEITLTEAQAAWLNALAEDKGYVTVSNGVASLSAARFEKAFLCNLDVTRGDFDATLGVTGIAVDEEKVAVEVTLRRTGAVQDGGRDAPINGVLRFYGAATVEAFRAALATMTPIADVAVDNADFGGGDKATVEIERTPDSDDRFFKVKIGEK